jgi:hypothetical protein
MLRGLGAAAQLYGNGAQYAGLAGAGVGAVAGIAGAATGDVPLAGAGVLIEERSASTIAWGETVSKVGAFLSAAGGDFSGLGPTPIESLAGKIPGVSSLSEPLRNAINQGIDKAAEPISEKLGCHG